MKVRYSSLICHVEHQDIIPIRRRTVEIGILIGVGHASTLDSPCDQAQRDGYHQLMMRKHGHCCICLSSCIRA